MSKYPVSQFQPLLDFDGVLFDFNTAAKLANGITDLDNEPSHWDWNLDYNISNDQFWKNIESCGSDFYRDGSFYPWAWEIVEKVRDYGQLVIVTNGPTFVDGKIQRIKREFPDAHVILMTASLKHWMARPQFLLVDDKNENVCEFVQQGGMGILFPQPWNSAGGFVVPANRGSWFRAKIERIHNTVTKAVYA